MNNIKFTDGVGFNTAVNWYHLTRRKDGWYVVGKGLLCAVNSAEEGRDMIREMQEIDKLHARAPQAD